MPPKKAKLAEKQFVFPKNFQQLQHDKYFKPQPESLIDGQIITIDTFFTKDLCNELINSFTNGLTLETTPLIKSRDYAARFNDRVSVTDYEAADLLWQYLKDVLLQTPDYEDESLDKIRHEFRAARSLNPQLRIYRYTKGHHFGQHYDELVRCPLAHNPKAQGTTKWTLLIYLTGGAEFAGGGTIFYPDSRGEPMNVHPSKGMALLHKHGDDCLRHEAELVKSGAKWVLRSDVTF